MHHESARAPRRTLLAAVAGLALALPFLGLFILHRDGAYDLLTLILAFTGGIYGGAAVRTGAPRAKAATEFAVGAAMVVVAALSLWWSPIWLVAGYGAHAAWDVLHHARGGAPGVHRWFPGFCAVFDVAVAVMVFVFT
ncbi:MAG TPA: DUF6010 family protein [Longimicrobium sp.]|jgi:hypothetical protein|uniref:DUF6010 family protein n=1 Tax=Longimicrobium sp. TaxID=2029185 RepID=UPI002EDB5BD8